MILIKILLLCTSISEYKTTRDSRSSSKSQVEIRRGLSDCLKSLSDGTQGTDSVGRGGRVGPNTRTWIWTVDCFLAKRGSGGLRDVVWRSESYYRSSEKIRRFVLVFYRFGSLIVPLYTFVVRVIDRVPSRTSTVTDHGNNGPFQTFPWGLLSSGQGTRTRD